MKNNKITMTEFAAIKLAKRYGCRAKQVVTPSGEAGWLVIGVAWIDSSGRESGTVYGRHGVRYSRADLVAVGYQAL